MFRGINSVNLDAKGRMALPARFREQVLSVCSGHLVVTIDPTEKCLLLYPLHAWEEVQANISELANMRTKSRTMQRILIGHATDVELDGSGRVLLPAMLREYAELEKKLVLIGQINKIEIWSETHWQASMNNWLADRHAMFEDSDEFTGISV